MVSNNISTVAEFITSANEKIHKLKDDTNIINMWFRGESIHKTNRTPLLPKGYRMYNTPCEQAYKNAICNEGNLFAQFEIQSLPYLLKKGISPTKWNIYYMMVHYGISTRLLDWSQSALISLYFAIEDLNINDDAIFWILNPHRLNKFSSAQLHENNSGFSSIIVPKEVKKQDLFNDKFQINAEELSRIYLNMDFEISKSYYPLAIMPTFLDERMSAQQSCFTIFGNIVDGLLSINEEERKTFLDYIIIDKNAKRNIKNELQWLGITHRSIYPDLEGICKTIEYENNMDSFIFRRIK